jgi:PAS domain S-box-containing protein
MIHVVDRSDARQATIMRRQVEDRFDILIDTISEGVLLMDANGVFRDCNAAAEKILGRPAADIIGSRFTDEQWSGLRQDGTPLPNAEFPFWQAVVEREAMNDDVMGLYPPGGPPRWIRVNAQPLFEDDADEPYGVLTCFDDITDEQLKDEALQTSRDLLSSVLSSSLDGIMVFSAVRDDNDGDIEDFEFLLVNPQAEKMVNRSSDSLVGTRLLEEMPGHVENGLFEAYVEVVETGEPFETEVHYTTDDVDRWLQIVAVRIEEGFAVTFRDISERKRAAQAMAATNAKLEQRNRALRDFAYIASHDLQEPLRKIGAFSNLVLEDYGDKIDDTGQHYLERMQDAARRMSQLISDLLVYSRVTTQARPFKPVDLEQIVANVVTDLEMQIADVDGTVDIGDLPTIAADSTQIRQLLQNLIGNGLKFHRPDVPPVVTIRSELVDPDDPSVPANDVNATRFCRLTVADNGIGFEQKYADRIFTPFKRLHGRSKYSGTGMGLAICRRIVERHGGDISVVSTPDEGTTFTIHLPVDRRDGDGANESSVQDHATTPTTLDE